ncbi:uncharacterized protein LOC130989689 isoform X2 [Salvia miltiorrhiza]|uniref:uncharacterized protein LOC130989689 isoform X2 n=1 Tax=Salvia miltiorrhiza TaxID=226208 RepID=UPI0025AB88B9|nr:uncharacterized protein LOC130989689 isoform X2 [Salvia miltiorrhiza]XP_057769739.1 uncharacterized protein LOC130989689 isoform X2 [Salvia miltiorrhiza]XP_057769740.1 uncharacterized protein LOC130989689 isoform X2 [Salvia miltiorrhiza]
MEKIEGQIDGTLEASSDIMDTDVEKDLLEADLTVESLAENLKASAGPTENIPEEIADSEHKRKENLKKAKAAGEIRNVDQANIDIGSIESIAEGNPNGKRKRGSILRYETKIMNQATGSSNFHSSESRITENECPAKDFEISVRKESSLSVSVHEVSDENITNNGQCSAEGGSIFSTCNVEGTSHLSSPNVNEAECLSKDLGYNTRITPMPSIVRKLIVLDVNGLLANIVMPAPKDYRADEHILGRAIFKRPFCDDFLKFCFQNFAVAVWSSRSKRIIERVVDYLLGDQKDKLLFCWDMSHSTQTGFNTLENIYKPLVFKELRKIWENDDPSLPWKLGDYNESNTLLLDDSPYKALLNPALEAIFEFI